MAKPELGTKRQCQNCGSKFYDLQRDPIICPKCGTVFQGAIAARGGRAAAAAAAEEDEIEIDPAVAVADIVPLEEADAPEDEKVLVASDDVEIEDEVASDDVDAFLEPEEDENDDVADLIDGDIGEDEES